MVEINKFQIIQIKATDKKKTILKGVRYHEKDVSAVKEKKSQCSRFQEKNVHKGRKEGSFCTEKKGSRKADRIR